MINKIKLSLFLTLTIIGVVIATKSVEYSKSITVMIGSEDESININFRTVAYDNYGSLIIQDSTSYSDGDTKSRTEGDTIFLTSETTKDDTHYKIMLSVKNEHKSKTKFGDINITSDKFTKSELLSPIEKKTFVLNWHISLNEGNFEVSVAGIIGKWEPRGYLVFVGPKSDKSLLDFKNSIRGLQKNPFILKQNAKDKQDNQQ